MVKNKNISSAVCSAVLILSAALGLNACGDKEVRNGQAILKVNGHEITVHQLNQELALESVEDAAGKDQTLQRKKALENIIDRELLSSKAQQDGLNRDVDIMLALERIKSEVLAQAYVQKHLESVPAPSEAEVSAFYNAHPNHYAQRKIFDMKEVEIDSADFTDKVEDAVANSKSLDDALAWLDIHRIKNKVSQTLRSSAEIPEQIADKARSPDSPKIFVLNASGETRLIALAPLKDSPVSLQDASSGISEFLVSKKKEEITQAMMEGLRADAKLEVLNLKAVGLDDANPSFFVDSAAKPTGSAAATTSKNNVEAQK